MYSPCYISYKDREVELVYLEGSTVKSINMYPGVSSRITTGTIINYGKLKW